MYRQRLPAAGKLARLGRRERGLSSRMGSLYCSRFHMTIQVTEPLLQCMSQVLAQCNVRRGASIQSGNGSEADIGAWFRSWRAPLSPAETMHARAKSCKQVEPNRSQKS